MLLLLSIRSLSIEVILHFIIVFDHCKTGLSFNINSSCSLNHRQLCSATRGNIFQLSGKYQQEEENIPITLPDYLITDSTDLSYDQRPTLLQALSNPRDLLASTVIVIGTIMSIFNILGVYDNTYLLLETSAIALGVFSSISSIAQIKTGYLISPNIRRGITDDAAINLYAAYYTGAVTWLALRTSEVCPEVMTLKGVDVVLSSLSIIIFVYSLAAPIFTLLANGTNDNKDGDINTSYKISQQIVSSARGIGSIDEKSYSGRNDNDDNTYIMPPLSDTELLRGRGLLFIGLLGCVFTPDALSFLLGGQEWWDRITTIHPSQRMLESSTSLFALFATESSMIAHRVGKIGVAEYKTIVPVFAGVCTLLAIVPCICALNWLGDDISFFSFYRE